MKSKRMRLALTLAFALISGIVLLCAFAQTHRDSPDQDDEEESVQAPARVTVQNGQTFIHLSRQGQSRAGIEVMKLEPAHTQRHVTAPALVLDVRDLVTFSANYAAAQANLRKAENNLGVSQKEYGRLKTLYSTQQNVSAKTFQSAEGTFLNDQTDVQTARQNLEFAVTALRQSWGDEIAKWALEGSPIFQRILSRHDILVQVTLPADGPANAPPEISLELPGHGRAAARWVCRFPRVDPRIQGASFLYRTPERGGLAPGLNLVADLVVGPHLQGVVVPSSAIVWWRGEAWVYKQVAAGKFTRQRVSTDNPAGDGLFVSAGLSPGESIVRAGAQALLSEELRSQIQPEG